MTQWHRYKPDESTGWTEYYIGFDSPIADHFFLQKSVLNGRAFIKIGNHEELIDKYYKIFSLIQEEKPGFQEIASGMILKLLGYIIAFQKQRDFTKKPLEASIQNLRFDIRKELLPMPELDKYALESIVSTDYFRNRRTLWKVRIMLASSLLMAT